MTRKKLIRIVKKSITWFGAGAVLAGTITAVVAAFVAAFPLVAATLLVLGVAVLCGVAAGWHAGKQYDDELAKEARYAEHEQYSHDMFEEIERQVRELKALEEEHLRWQAEEVAQLKLRGIEIHIPCAEHKVHDLPLSPAYAKGSSALFHAASNDLRFTEEEKSVMSSEPSGSSMK